MADLPNLTVARGAQNVTKSDSAVFDPPLNGIWVGGLGDVTLVTGQNDTVLFSAVPAGTFIPVRTKQVLSAGTTATLLAGFK